MTIGGKEIKRDSQEGGQEFKSSGVHEFKMVQHECLFRWLSLRGVRRRSNLGEFQPRLLRFARNDKLMAAHVHSIEPLVSRHQERLPQGLVEGFREGLLKGTRKGLSKGTNDGLCEGIPVRLGKGLSDELSERFSKGFRKGLGARFPAGLRKEPC